MSERKTIHDASEIVLPDSFKCPICDAAIFIEEVDAWHEDDDGEMIAEAVKIDCSTFPGFDDNDEFNAYMRSHWSMPYVDWLPLETIVTEWVNKRYVWDLG
jgi:hypothetical protein